MELSQIFFYQIHMLSNWMYRMSERDCQHSRSIVKTARDGFYINSNKVDISDLVVCVFNCQVCVELAFLLFLLDIRQRCWFFSCISHLHEKFRPPPNASSDDAQKISQVNGIAGTVSLKPKHSRKFYSTMSSWLAFSAVHWTANNCCQEPLTIDFLPSLTGDCASCRRCLVTPLTIGHKKSAIVKGSRQHLLTFQCTAEYSGA